MMVNVERFSHYWLSDPVSACATLALTYIVYYILAAVYNLYFSPLAKYPGPKIRAISDWPKWINYIRGDTPYVMKQLHDQYGPLVRISPNRLDFGTAQAFKDIHGHENIDKKIDKWYEAYTFADLDDGIRSVMTDRKADHARVRRILSHAFSSSALRAQHPIFRQHSMHLTQKLRNVSTSSITSETPTVTNIEFFYIAESIDLITDLALGKAFNALASGVEHPWWTAISDVFRLGRFSLILAGSPVLQFISKAFLTLFPQSEQARCLAQRAYHVKLVEEMARERMLQADQKERKDIVHYMLQRMDEPGEKGISEAEMLRNLATLLGAGTETTVSLLCAATYFLLQHPGSLQQLQDELANAFPDGAETIEQVDLLRLPYLNAVIEEALRLRPPVVEALPRICTQDVLIDGHVVPKGTIVGMNPYAAGRAQWNFKDAEDWRPERWLGGEEWNSDSRGASNAFGIGPRNCVGMSLAIVNIKLVLASVFLTFDLTLAPDSQNWLVGQTAHIGWEKPPLNVILQEIQVEKPRQSRMDSAVAL